MPRKRASWKIGVTAGLLAGAMGAPAAGQEPITEFIPDGLTHEAAVECAAFSRIWEDGELDQHGLLPFEEWARQLDRAADTDSEINAARERLMEKTRDGEAIPRPHQVAMLHSDVSARCGGYWSNYHLKLINWSMVRHIGSDDR